MLDQTTLLTGEQSTTSSISSRFSTIIVLDSVADLEMNLDSGEPKPMERSKPIFSRAESEPNGFGVSLKSVWFIFIKKMFDFSSNKFKEFIGKMSCFTNFYLKN